MRRQIFLPIIHDHPYICFPEAVGWYEGDGEHCAIRKKNELHCYNLHVIVSGKGYIMSNNETYVLQQGDAFLYYPEEEQYYYADSENPWEILWVHFHGDYLKNYFIEKGFHLSTAWTLKLWGHVREAIVALLEEVEQYAILHPSVYLL